MNDLEIYAAAVCVIFIVVAVVLVAIFGRDEGCCADCCQGGNCKCQR